MKAAATTTPGDQELELGTACCANSLFLILGLSFSPSPFRPAPPLSPPHGACIPCSGSAPHFPAAVPRRRGSCGSPAPLGGQGAPRSKKRVLVKRSVFQLLETQAVGTGVYTKSALRGSAELVRTKQNLDNKHRAFLFSQLSHPLGNLPLHDAFRSARVYTFPAPGGGDRRSCTRGIPNRYSARRGGASPTAEPAQ